jgi:predicted peptidase
MTRLEINIESSLPIDYLCTRATGLLLVALMALVLSSVGASMAMAQQPLSDSTDPHQLFEPREYRAADGQSLKYRLLKPVEFDPEDKYPLVVFLHGAGERGDDNTAQLKHCLSEFCTPDRRKNYPCYVLAPQCPAEQKWVDVDWSNPSPVWPDEISPSLKMTLEVVDAMLADAAVDKNQVYVAGLSMGGYGTWDALARRPQFFAAAIPICGGGNPENVASYRNVPIWCFHGDLDTAVPVESSRSMIAALQQAGGEPRYTEYPGVKHDSWTRPFANEETFVWLFSQRRNSSEAN